MYIIAQSNISPQDTFQKDEIFSPLFPAKESIRNIRPFEAKAYIPQRLLRRMSSAIKSAVVASKVCMDSTDERVDAIITGTGLGCLADTEKFLRDIHQMNEGAVSPTSFIQSTHNTVSGQIALINNCKGYNTTYSHRGLSIENGLLDAQLLLTENKEFKVLLGGVDEQTQLLQDLIPSLSSESKNDSFALGEGACYFLLSNQRKKRTDTKIVDFNSHQIKKGNEQIKKHLDSFLKKNKLSPSDIDCVFTGRNGLIEHDQLFDELYSKYSFLTLDFKNYCGEYPSATAFAIWLASKSLEQKRLVVPNALSQKPMNRILIHNAFITSGHSFILLSND